jgi:TPR repeat protein
MYCWILDDRIKLRRELYDTLFVIFLQWRSQLAYSKYLTTWAVVVVCVFFIFSPVIAAELDEAQLAASEGRYRDVVTLLTDVLESEDLDGPGRVVAHSNRGIAYSLLNAYALARKDLNEALKIDPEHALTMNHLGLLAEKLEQDYRAAADYYERAAVQGFAASRVNLSKLYANGLGVGQSDKKAFDLLQEAVFDDYTIAYEPLGVMMTEGRGTQRNSRAGVAMFQKAAAAGVADGQYSLGRAYEKGIGVSVNKSKAAEFYLNAAVQGNGNAQNALGYLYRRGSGVPQSYLEAAKWYRLSADQGFPSAMNRLAWLLAGCPAPEVCDGELAVQLVQDAFNQAGFSEDERPGYQDSLAAGYARAGQFDLAIKTLNETLAKLAPGDRQYSGFARRLALYKTGIPNQL